jgi:hypothetical protein
MNKDLEHLRLLSIFHYVVGGILALFACFPIIHLIMGIMFLTMPIPPGRDVCHYSGDFYFTWLDARNLHHFSRPKFIAAQRLYFLFSGRRSFVLFYAVWNGSRRFYNSDITA